MNEEWLPFATFAAEASAQALLGRLQLEGVPAVVESLSSMPGFLEVRVLVPSRLHHRAKWIAALAERTDAELTYLATGELSGDDGR